MMKLDLQKLPMLSEAEAVKTLPQDIISLVSRKEAQSQHRHVKHTTRQGKARNANFTRQGIPEVRPQT